MRPLNGVKKNDSKKKRNIYKFYYITKGRMDIVGQLDNYYLRVTDGTFASVTTVAFYSVFDKIEFEFEFVNDRRVLSPRNNKGSKSLSSYNQSSK